jgi:hypothetical protein
MIPAGGRLWRWPARNHQIKAAYDSGQVIIAAHPVAGSQPLAAAAAREGLKWGP